MKRLLLLLPFLFFLFACGIMVVPATVEKQPTSEILPTPDKKQAWEATFQPVQVIPSVYCVSAAESLNLRLSPSTSAEADPEGLQHGDKVTRISIVPGWLEVETADGRRGWVKASYLEECDGT